MSSTLSSLNSSLKYLLVITTILSAGFISNNASAQIDEDQLGAWYMYFWNTRFEDSNFGLQGDIQHRNWDLGGDLEQLLIRGGATYSPDGSNLLYTLGFASITSGQFGNSDNTSHESRVYQELLVPQVLGTKFFLRHRLRLEQRWVENQDFRTRFRYNLFLDIPLNQNNLGKGAIYLSFYNELFINGEQDIGGGRRVDNFDRNRFFTALGYSMTENLRVQFGLMHQNTKNTEKTQLQFGLTQRF